jgi:ABC-type lipoprotein release transport system permease subunit
LVGVGPFDPLALASTIALILIVSLAASWFPARRATHVIVASVLRGQ